jgi:hypothetical protein
MEICDDHQGCQNDDVFQEFQNGDFLQDFCCDHDHQDLVNVGVHQGLYYGYHGGISFQVLVTLNQNAFGSVFRENGIGCGLNFQSVDDENGDHDLEGYLNVFCVTAMGDLLQFQQ